MPLAQGVLPHPPPAFLPTHPGAVEATPLYRLSSCQAQPPPPAPPRSLPRTPRTSLGRSSGRMLRPQGGEAGSRGAGSRRGGGEGDGCPGLATGIVMRLYSKLRQSSSQCKSCSFGQFRELRGCQHMVRGEKGERGASQIAADGNGWRNVSAHTKPTIRTVKPKRRELRRFLA